MARKQWVKKRHKAVFSILRGIFRPFVKCKYNFVAKKSDIKGPCLIMSNHAATFDPFFLSLSFKCPVYFFASDDLFNIKGVSPIIQYLVAPIPKSKSMADMQAVRDCLTICRQGGAVGLFPEGNRTLSGLQWQMSDAVAKLVKVSKVPLVLYNIEGGYGADPRWGKKVRKGKMRGYVKMVIYPEEYCAMSVEELFDIICRELTVDDVHSGVRFKSRRRAENIERVLYMCPHCGGISTITSSKTKFHCTACGKEWEYTEDMRILPAEPFDAIPPWHEWEKSQTELLARQGDGVIFQDDGIRFRESVRLKRKKKLDGNRIAADNKGLTVVGKGTSSTYLFDEMDGLTVVGKRKFNFYYHGKTYQVKGDKRFCSLKYLHLFEGVRNV